MEHVSEALQRRAFCSPSFIPSFLQEPAKLQQEEAIENQGYSQTQ
jgi:hypothetical protein